MKPYDNFGREMDATFSVEVNESGFDLVFESRSGASRGSRDARNSEYAQGLELLLSRLAPYHPVVQALMIDSTIARKLPEPARILTLGGFETPFELSPHTDISALRLELGRKSSAFGRTADLDGGNRTKRVRLRFGAVPDLTSLQVIERIFTHPANLSDVVGPDAPTDENDRFDQDINDALADFRRQGGVPAYAGSSDPAKNKSEFLTGGIAAPMS